VGRWITIAQGTPLPGSSTTARKVAVGQPRHQSWCAKVCGGLDRVHDLTVGQFYREVAKLGGFLGRKGDGGPGWITIWRGWEKLNNLVRAASLASKLKLRV